MPLTDTFVGVSPDSTGKKVRNLQVSVLQADGTTATVLMQVIGVADANGNLLDLDDANRLDELLAIQRQIRTTLRLILAELHNPTGLLDVDDDPTADGLEEVDTQ